MENKKYGHFDDANREYVITDPKTPWPWINYLGNENFFSLISNTAGGYSFSRMPSSAGLLDIDIIMYPWTTGAGISISRMEIASGVLDGNP